MTRGPRGERLRSRGALFALFRGRTVIWPRGKDKGPPRRAPRALRFSPSGAGALAATGWLWTCPTSSYARAPPRRHRSGARGSAWVSFHLGLVAAGRWFGAATATAARQAADTRRRRPRRYGGAGDHLSKLRDSSTEKK